jgi:hypothetical protein
VPGVFTYLFGAVDGEAELGVALSRVISTGISPAAAMNQMRKAFTTPMSTIHTVVVLEPIEASVGEVR